MILETAVVDRRLSLYRRGDYPWLLILSVVIGGILALFLAIVASQVINTSSFQSGYLPIFFRYAAVCSVAGVLFRHVHAGDVKGTEFLNAFFRSGLNCTVRR